LLLIFNANFTETKVPLLKQLFRGQYNDFNNDWYKDIGVTLIKAMSISAIMPIIEFFIDRAKTWGRRFFDRGLTSSEYNSRSKSIQSYVDVYAGPEFMIHFRYSAILNTCFVTLMYGVGMPYLFPISLINFCVLYLMERYCVTYYYR
jgi:hypothetical protein